MLDNTDYQTYKNSPFRQYAKRSLRFRYKPENDNEAFLYNKLKRYILTGNTKRGQNSTKRHNGGKEMNK